MTKSKRSQPSKAQPSLPKIPPPELGATGKTEPEQQSSPEFAKRGGDFLIVDNSDEHWKVSNYLDEWSDISSAFDIATGFFEIGALLTLDGSWQKIDRIRILMGYEVSKRTKQALLDGLSMRKHQLDQSIEGEKDENDFLDGVPTIVEGMDQDKSRSAFTPTGSFTPKRISPTQNLM